MSQMRIQDVSRRWTCGDQVRESETRQMTVPGAEVSLPDFPLGLRPPHVLATQAIRRGIRALFALGRTMEPTVGRGQALFPGVGHSLTTGGREPGIWRFGYRTVIGSCQLHSQSGNFLHSKQL